MKRTFMGLLLSVSSVSQADVIKCIFTEPFIDTTYSMTQSILTYTSSESKKPKVIKNVSFQIKSAGVFELISKNGQVLQRLTLSGKGSDGMSEFIYPYDVEDKSLLTAANNGIGACSSNYLKIVKP